MFYIKNQFRVPLAGIRRDDWIRIIKENSSQKFVEHSSYQVCSLHFRKDQLKTTRNKIKLVGDALPCIFNTNNNVDNQSNNNPIEGNETESLSEAIELM